MYIHTYTHIDLCLHLFICRHVSLYAGKYVCLLSNSIVHVPASTARLSIYLFINLSVIICLFICIHTPHTHTHPNGSIRIARIAWTFMLLSHSVGSIFLQMRNTSVYVILLEHVYKSYRPEPIYVYKQTHKD